MAALAVTGGAQGLVQTVEKKDKWDGHKVEGTSIMMLLLLLLGMEVGISATYQTGRKPEPCSRRPLCIARTPDR